MLVHQRGKWVIYSKSNGKRLGVYSSKEKAVEKERQIQFFKHRLA